MVNASGASGEKAIWGERSNWVDDYGRVAGEDVGLAFFDHPQNLAGSHVLARLCVRAAGGESVRPQTIYR
jgi:Family of unknown function (DUF6807)